MESMVKILLWGWILLEPGVGSVSLPEITDGKFIEQCVKEHNDARSSVNPPASDMRYMTWDEALAITARAWARRCVFEHNTYLKDVRSVHPTFPSVGENIWAAYPPSTFEVGSAINGSWVAEKQHYKYKENTCSDKCGHYTQVVWASSYKVGCAVQLCPNGVKGTHFATKEGVVFVCNYATAGNMNRQQPYKSQGAACSGCEGTCEKNLCRNQEHDELKSYSWTPDWDLAVAPGGSTNAAAGSSLVAVLVTRPIGLICTFIAAYAVHYFYPNIFFYE